MMLNGQTIILIAPHFFGYSAEIENLLVSWGARVFRYENRPSTKVWMKILIRVFPRLSAPISERYFERIFEQHLHDNITRLLVLRGEALSPRAVRRFAELFPGVPRTMYLWDSFRNDRLASAKVGGMNWTCTFDPLDARRDSRLSYLPLFYLKEFAQMQGRQPDLDLSFVGTIHSDRYSILKRIKNKLRPNIKAYFFMYFPSRLQYWMRRVGDPDFWSARPADFSFQSLSKTQVSEIFSRSNVVIDIERTIQAGLTMRTIEALGAQRKLVTTNPLVRHHDFFDPANIWVIDRKSPEIPEEFLTKPFQKTSLKVLEKYSIEHWLKTLLGLEPLSSYWIENW